MEMEDPGLVDGIVLGITIFVYIFTALVASTVIILLLYVIRGVRSVQLGERLPGVFDDSEQFYEEEQAALELMDDRAKQSYLMAKRWIEHNPPNSADTDISLSQYLTIQEKAVGAWEFTFDVLQQPMVYVHNRTEIDFRSHRGGSDDMCCVQTNLPLPSQKEVYYWETKIYDSHSDTKIAVGLTTKPYPGFRLPGMHKYSVSYESQGIYRLNQPFSGMSYGRQWQRGDVIGVGYRTRTGTVFFTHNGKKLDDVVHGMKVNLFPTVGSTGPADVYVNLGQDGFVFIQANVKEWGLASAMGSLAPPPAYGDQRDSLLLESTRMERLAGPSNLMGNIDPNGRVVDGTFNSGLIDEEAPEEEAPPYVQRQSTDDSHNPLAFIEIRTPPGTPPQSQVAVTVNSETSATDAIDESTAATCADTDNVHTNDNATHNSETINVNNLNT